MKNIEFCIVMIANGIFHPNGTSKFGATKGSGVGWQAYPACAGYKVTIRNHGLKRCLPAALGKFLHLKWIKSSYLTHQHMKSQVISHLSGSRQGTETPSLGRISKEGLET
jgi:hypothetical protein